MQGYIKSNAVVISVRLKIAGIGQQMSKECVQFPPSYTKFGVRTEATTSLKERSARRGDQIHCPSSVIAVKEKRGYRSAWDCRSCRGDGRG
jgi:hypothetical protein